MRILFEVVLDLLLDRKPFSGGETVRTRTPDPSLLAIVTHTRKPWRFASPGLCFFQCRDCSGNRGDEVFGMEAVPMDNRERATCADKKSVAFFPRIGFPRAGDFGVSFKKGDRGERRIG